MAESHETGKQGEAIAAAYLAGMGWQILETNWYSNHQEADIIARQGNLLLIVEVKTRSTDYYGSPEEFVSKQKQRRLIKTANHYVSSNGLDLEVRFDIISIVMQLPRPRLKHIEDAFYPH
ncbi:MAG: YraN family protein [Bacteroidales bacterium]